ncbi:hypothetical protein EVAR_50320_1 [Eumeta japonica]|uniref:Uncharacterized protein n=1 Tax=Eumeta variegata TaxID=151549 RepID=A0A4C1XQF2_EUMVA|nr:hypothetical protein EVAR_50320_1 [Eumeta japonica]
MRTQALQVAPHTERVLIIHAVVTSLHNLFISVEGLGLEPSSLSLCGLDPAHTHWPNYDDKSKPKTLLGTELVARCNLS